MRHLKFFGTGLALALFFLITTATAEARTHFSFGFGLSPTTTIVEHRITPVYVEEYYSPAPVVVRRRPPCCDHVWVGSRREVLTYPSYREQVIVNPSPVFSFGIFH